MDPFGPGYLEVSGAIAHINKQKLHIILHG